MYHSTRGSSHLPSTPFASSSPPSSPSCRSPRPTSLHYHVKLGAESESNVPSGKILSLFVTGVEETLRATVSRREIQLPSCLARTGREHRNDRGQPARRVCNFNARRQYTAFEKRVEDARSSARSFVKWWDTLLAVSVCCARSVLFL